MVCNHAQRSWIAEQRGVAFVEIAVLLGALTPAIIAVILFMQAGGLGAVDRRMDLKATLAVAPSLLWLDGMVYINSAGQQALSPELDPAIIGEGGQSQIDNMLRLAARRVWSASSFRDENSGDGLCLRLVRVQNTPGLTIAAKTISSAAIRAGVPSEDCVLPDDSAPPEACFRQLRYTTTRTSFLVFIHVDAAQEEIAPWECEIGYPAIQAGGFQ